MCVFKYVTKNISTSFIAKIPAKSKFNEHLLNIDLVITPKLCVNNGKKFVLIRLFTRLITILHEFYCNTDYKFMSSYIHQRYRFDISVCLKFLQIIRKQNFLERIFCGFSFIHQAKKQAIIWVKPTIYE